MASSERYPLRQIILDDLTSSNKLALLLLFLVIATAIATIWVTHQTRLLTAEQGSLVKQNRRLENQYIHLQLEEYTLGHRDKVDEKAINFGLRPIHKDQEIILIQSK
ncbi:cell division protein FtsL [Actinobacillus minor]|uniref:cell division protein FtsL n=1 Tax=Actinobacillus minor TaxID=51047 RepID=UPI0026EC067F|nr:cell division protein FtsL [Actinobacillus minor]